MTDVENRRARLRSDVALAARVVPTHYPLETFIAVNPLRAWRECRSSRRSGGPATSMGLAAPSVRKPSASSTGRPDHRHRPRPDAGPPIPESVRRRGPPARQPDGQRFGTPPADLQHGTGSPQFRRRFLTRAEEQAPGIADTVDAQTSKWCAAFFGDAAWPMPGSEHGFYSAWRSLAPGDRSLHRTVRKELRRTPERADDAVLEALARLGVDADARTAYLQAHLTRMPGWAGHVQWCAAHGRGIDLVGYLAMRLTYEAALLERRPGPDGGGRSVGTGESVDAPSARDRAAHLIGVWNLGDIEDAEVAAAARVLTAMPVTSRAMLWQNAFEAHYRDDLLRQLGAGECPVAPGPVRAQLVTCIDTRSEGLRRRLESLGGYETLGFAGFFAVAIRYTGLLQGRASDLCPVLIAPNHDITENPASNGAGAAARQVSGATRLAGAESAFHAAKEAFAAPFIGA